MTDTSKDTWQGDAVGLVDAFRNGERSPLEELDASYAAIDGSELNAICFTDRETARHAAAAADVSKPFGGVPIGVTELTTVAGWPDTEASVPFRDRIADHTATMVQRIADDGGAVLAAQTTASEFGGVNVTRTTLHGVTHNPWQHGATPGGSSGGSPPASPDWSASREPSVVSRSDRRRRTATSPCPPGVWRARCATPLVGST